VAVTKSLRGKKKKTTMIFYRSAWKIRTPTKFTGVHEHRCVCTHSYKERKENNNKNNGSPFRLDHVNNNNKKKETKNNNEKQQRKATTTITIILQECVGTNVCPHPHRFYRSAWQMTMSALTTSFSRSAWTDMCPHPYPLFLQECIANGMLHSPHFGVEAKGQHHHHCSHLFLYLTPTSISNFIYNNVSPVAVQLHLPFEVPLSVFSGFYKFFSRIITNSNNLLFSPKPDNNNQKRFISCEIHGRQECVGGTCLFG